MEFLFIGGEADGRRISTDGKDWIEAKRAPHAAFNSARYMGSNYEKWTIHGLTIYREWNMSKADVMTKLTEHYKPNQK